MKVVVITVVILIIFFAGTIYINNHVERNVEEMKVFIDEIDKAVEARLWDESIENIKKLENSWSEAKRFWLLFIEHGEIDTIDGLTSKIKRFIEIEEREMAIGEIVSLREVLDHIVKKQSLRLSNIF